MALIYSSGTAWPAGQARTRTPLIRAKVRVSAATATARLERVVGKLKLTKAILVSGLVFRKDGRTPLAKQPAGELVAVLKVFDLGKEYALAVDRFESLAQNILAIAKTLEAVLAQRENYGFGAHKYLQPFLVVAAKTSSQAEQEPPLWYQVLGNNASLPPPKDAANFALVRKSYLVLARLHHPDNGGSTASMQELTGAWLQARQYFLGSA